jgi:hypothetical protein
MILANQTLKNKKVNYFRNKIVTGRPSLLNDLKISGKVFAFGAHDIQHTIARNSLLGVF